MRRRRRRSLRLQRLDHKFLPAAFWRRRMIVFELVFVREEILVKFITMRPSLMMCARVILVLSVLVGPIIFVVTVVMILRRIRIRRELRRRRRRGSVAPIGLSGALVLSAPDRAGKTATPVLLGRFFPGSCARSRRRRKEAPRAEDNLRAGGSEASQTGDRDFDRKYRFDRRRHPGVHIDSAHQKQPNRARKGHQFPKSLKPRCGSCS